MTSPRVRSAAEEGATCMSDLSEATAAKIELAEVGGISVGDLYELRWERRQRITTEKLISAGSVDALLGLVRGHFKFEGPDGGLLHGAAPAL
jgi:hypothetical protein